jgi:RNA polymerase sigma factor (TIGR02999 family)
MLKVVPAPTSKPDARCAWCCGLFAKVLLMSDLTHILAAIEEGDSAASEQLLPLVYDELRRLAADRLAHEKPGQTLQATALVHEAYLRLVNTEKAQQWNSRGHFFAAAAEAMRRILVNRARDKKRIKRGGAWKRVDFDKLTVVDDATDEELISLDEALERLAAENANCAELVKLRFFAGMTQGEAAAALGLPRRTADRTWAYARAWLFEALKHDPSASPPES